VAWREALIRLCLIWPESLLGTAVILASVLAGWRIGRRHRTAAVRLVSWWVERVIRPIVEGGSWLRRAVTIAANNTLICATVVALGAVPYAAWFAVAGVGLGLGIALRVMGPRPGAEPGGLECLPAGRRAAVNLGLALNLIEVPAIMLSAGLSLAQGAWSQKLTSPDALTAFGYAVVPMLIVAAAGEALWMTAGPSLGDVMTLPREADDE